MSFYATDKRLKELEDQHARAQARPGAVVMPAILPLDRWEAIAMQLQRKLSLASREDANK